MPRGVLSVAGSEVRIGGSVSAASKESGSAKGVIERPVRIARICTHQECVPPFRRFFSSEAEADRWECPDHGRSSVEVQVNKPYEAPKV